MADLKNSIYEKIDRVNKSRREFSRKDSKGGKRSRKYSRDSRQSYSNSSSGSSSSGDSRRSRKGNRSRSIIGRLKGDLAECDNLQLIKYSSVLKDRNTLEATNKEFANVVKELKKKVEEEQGKNFELQTKYKLLESSSQRQGDQSSKQIEIIQEYEENIRILKEGITSEKNQLIEKKRKWKSRINDLQIELEKQKESNITLDNRVNNYEQLTVNQDTMLTEEKEKIYTVESNLSILKNQLDEARKEALQNQEKTQGQETEIAELTVTLQYEARAATDIKAANEQLKTELQEKEKTISEIRKENKKKRETIIATKDAEINRITKECTDTKVNLVRVEGRAAELESTLDDIKDKFDDTLRQLNIAEIKLTELVKEKELVVELKSSSNDKDKDIQQKRDYINVVNSNIETRKRSFDYS